MERRPTTWQPVRCLRSRLNLEDVVASNAPQVQTHTNGKRSSPRRSGPEAHTRLRADTRDVSPARGHSVQAACHCPDALGNRGCPANQRAAPWIREVRTGGPGFFVTLGIVLYDQRNTQFYNGAITRAKYLECDLNLERFSTDEHRGLFGSRDHHSRRRFFGLTVRHDLGLAFIYSAVLGAWVFAAVRGATESRSAAIGVGGGFAVLAFLQFEWLDGQPKRPRQWNREPRRKMDERDLKRLNEQFAEAEKTRNKRFFEGVLAEELRFRRANGSLANKDEFLSALMDGENTYDSLQSSDVETIVFDDRVALVSLRVEARGKRSGETFEGTFRNTRLFVKQRRTWRCAIWFNSREGA
jgi:Domain of unknown function (DUF4440)